MENENGKTLARLEEWQKTVDGKLDHIMNTLDEAFKPEGFCSRSRAKLSAISTSIKIFWFLLGGVIIALITQALK